MLSMRAEGGIRKEKGAVRSVLMSTEGAFGEISVIGARVMGTGESLIRRYTGVVVVILDVVEIRGSHRDVREVRRDLVVLARDGCRAMIMAVRIEVGLFGCSARTKVG